MIRDFDNGCNKFLQEALMLKEIWPETIYEINQKTLDMRTIMVLVSHYHDGAVAKSEQIILIYVLFSILQTHDLDQILHFIIVIHKFEGDISNIQELSLEREHSVLVPTHDLDSTHGQTLSRVSLCQNQGALHRLLGSRPICVLKLRDTVQFRFLSLSSKIPLQFSSLSQLSTLHYILNY